MSKITIIEGNSNNKDDVRAIMVKGEKGYSAYEIAVQNGYAGTEEEWVNSFINATNYYNKTEVDNKLLEKANVTDIKTDSDIVDLIYPVGSIYMSVNNTSPSTLFGGTWVEWGTGKVPIGVDTSDNDFNTVEKTGGEKTHILTIDEIPSHNHELYGWTYNAGPEVGTEAEISSRTARTTEYYSSTRNAGGGQAHNNLQPYITCYMWKRTA